jgi:hypothetical protein
MIVGNTIDRTGATVVVNLIKLEDITKDLNVFFFRRWADLVEAGHAGASYMPSFKQGATRILYITIDDAIAGHILFEFATPKDSFIHFTVVEEKFRRNGLYHIMHSFYDKVMKHNNVSKSRSHLHINNTAIIEAAKSVGYDIEYYKMVKEY